MPPNRVPSNVPPTSIPSSSISSPNIPSTTIPSIRAASRKRSAKVSLPSRRATRQAPGSSGIAKSARRLLAALHAGTPIEADPVDADILIAADLARRAPDGTLSTTEAGRSHLARLDAARTGTIDPFLGQHLDLVRTSLDTAAGRTETIVDAAESPLVWLARRKGRDGRPLIETVQLQAGERLRSDFTRAQLMPRTTSSWNDGVVIDGHAGSGDPAARFTDTMIASRQRVRHALDAVGPELAGLLIDVCCFLKGLEDAERQRGWPPRSAKVVLQLGLDRLARHYGYGAVAQGKAHAAMRTWLAAETADAAG